MKKRSLVAAFTLAAATFITAGAANAQSVTIPTTPGNNQVWSEQAPVQATSASVSQTAIDDLTYNVGVQTPYYRTGIGFTQGTTTTGENIGVEYRLNGSNATPIKAYNLNDPASRQMFQQEVNTAYNREQNLANQEMYSAANYNYYPPASYVICAPPVAIMPFGFVIGGWYAGYTPFWMTSSFRPWGGFWEGGHRIVNRTTIVNNTVIERGGARGAPALPHGNNNVIHNNVTVPNRTATIPNRAATVPNRTFNNVAPRTVAPVRTMAPASNGNVFRGSTGSAGRVSAAPARAGGFAGGGHGGGRR